MAPMSMRCLTCSEYIPKGKKFNARKEKAKGEHYLNIQIYRFFIKCPLCASEITFKTDPKNTDYVCENGAQRNFEPWRDESRIDQELKDEKAKLEENDPMKALENRTMDSKREMDILDALDELRTKNARNERMSTNESLDKLLEIKMIQEQEELKKQELQDEEIAKSMFYNADGEYIKRVDFSMSSSLSSLNSSANQYTSQSTKQFTNPSEKRKGDSLSLLGIIKKKKSSDNDVQSKDVQNSTLKKEKETNGLSLLGNNYASSNDSD